MQVQTGRTKEMIGLSGVCIIHNKIGDSPSQCNYEVTAQYDGILAHLSFTRHGAAPTSEWGHLAM